MSAGVKSEHEACLRLFGQLTRPLKARLHHPMLVRSILDGAERLYPEYYTSGAREFQEAGGELVQWGVANVRFYPA